MLWLSFDNAFEREEQSSDQLACAHTGQGEQPVASQIL